MHVVHFCGLRALATTLGPGMFATLIALVISGVRGGDHIITEFGAMGDGTTLNTLAIQKTINAVAAEGGGRVLVPAGTFLTGTINLTSNVYLYLDKQGILQGSSNPDDYPYDWDYWVLVMTERATNTGIIGEGTIVGCMWDLVGPYDATQNQFQPKTWEGVRGCKGECRPRLIGFTDCTHVALQGVTLRDSADWTCVFRRVRHLLVEKVTIRGDLRWANNDGMDLESTQDAVIRDCDIDVADDGIVLSSGNTNDLNTPWPEPVGSYTPVERVLIERVVVRSRSSAVKLEAVFQQHGDIRQITVRDITVFDSARGLGFQMHSGEGSWYDLTYSNIDIETRFITGTNWWARGEPIWMSVIPERPNMKIGGIWNVSFTDIRIRSENSAFFSGRSTQLRDIRLQNVSVVIDTWTNVSYPQHDYRPVSGFPETIPAQVDGIFVEYTESMRLINCSVTFKPPRDQKWGGCINASDHVSQSGFKNFGFACNRLDQ